MKKIIAAILSICIVFNLITISEGYIVNAVESDIIWLEKDYDWIDGNLIKGMGGFSEEVAPVGLNDKMGYINKDGKEVISLRYDWASRFKEGLGRVAIEGKFGFINKSGEQVISLEYDAAGDFSEGLTWVNKNDKYGYIDKNGREVVSFKYDFVKEFSEGLAVVSKDGKYGYIDKKGKEVIPLKYDDANTFSEGLGEIRVNNQIGFIDKNDKLIIPAVYYSWYDDQPFWGAEYMEGIVGYEQDEIGAIEYREGTRFREGLAMVRVESGYGYIDKNNNFIIPPTYYDVSEFKEGLAIVNSEEFNYGYIDKKDQQIIKIRYDSQSEFSEGLSLVQDNLYGYMDKTGKEVISLRYEDATSFKDGLAFVKLNNKWGIIKNPLKKDNISFIGDENKISGSKYTGYKEVYYDYLKEFVANKIEVGGIEGLGEYAILLDLNGDGIPELITYLWGKYDGGYETHEYLDILTYNNSKLEKMHELDFYSGGKFSEYGNLYQNKDTGEFYTIKQSNLATGTFYEINKEIFKLYDNEFNKYKQYEFTWESHSDIGDVWTVNDQEVDEEVFSKKQDEYSNYIDNLIEIIPRDIDIQYLTDEKIMEILDSFIDEPEKVLDLNEKLEEELIVQIPNEILDDKKDTKRIPIVPIARGVGLLGLGSIGGYIFSRRKINE